MAQEKMVSMDVIEVEGLRKRFEDVVAVDGVSFRVRKGEVFGLLGPNGAGKTTTIRMLSTLLRPDSGTARVCGFDILKERQEVRKRIGIVFQEPALDGKLTGRENLVFHGMMYGLSKKEAEERAEALLELVELSDRADSLVETYSGGMKRRLEIARGLVHKPEVLFLDEPTLGLDAQTRRRVWDYIRLLNKKAGITIILTTHYMEEADYLCERVAIIDLGRIIALDKPKKLKDGIGKDIIMLESPQAGRLAGILRKRQWVKGIKSLNGQVELSVESGERKIPMIFELAGKAGIRIRSVSLRKPTLEDVFIFYTGRRIREE